MARKKMEWVSVFAGKTSAADKIKYYLKRAGAGAKVKRIGKGRHRVVVPSDRLGKAMVALKKMKK